MNFRFAFCAAIMVIVSIILSTMLFISQKMKLSLIFIFAIGFLLLIILFSIFKKRFLLMLSAIILIGIIPVVSIYFKAEKINKNKLLLSDTNTFSGKIVSVSKELDRNAIFFELSNVEIIDGEERKDFKGLIYVRLVADGVDTSKLKLGGFVTILNSNIEIFTLNEGSSEIDRSFISKGVTARSYIFAYNLKVEDRVSLTIRDRIKNSVFNTFKETDTFFTSIGYAMIFGETDALNDEVYDVFKDAGIAHLLAVSGFHISVIVSFLIFILNKFKANKYLKISIVSILLFVYVYLCSFSASVIRASIMAILLLYSTNRNKEYDKLSSLSLALIFILLISPMQLFSISFILSFVSILSIILLMPIFERYLSKAFNEKLSSSLSLSLAVCLGLAVFQLYYFGTYPILSLISNILTIPIVGLIFIYLIVSVIIGSIFNIAVPLINGFGFCMKFITQLNNWIAKNGLYISCGEFGGLTLLLPILIMFIISDFVFIKKRIKLPIAGVLFLLLVLVMI